jgi:hypothetical protein
MPTSHWDKRHDFDYSVLEHLLVRGLLVPNGSSEEEEEVKFICESLLPTNHQKERFSIFEEEVEERVESLLLRLIITIIYFPVLIVCKDGPTF